MTLAVSVQHKQGDFELDAAFESKGRLTALFGPSGSGKSTLINAIAGLISPDRGRITVDERVMSDTDRRVFLPVHRRRIGYVFQDARLFPHLSVTQNLNYGRWFTPAADRYVEPGAVIELLGIGHLLDRKPAMLSGGEKSRVAIGRALLTSPKLMLMDEPFASLDDARKAEIFPYIERLRDEFGIPIVYVSHSIAEVARLATDVVVLAEGKVRASGPAGSVFARPDLLPRSDQSEAGALVELEMVARDDGYGLSLLRSSGGEWRLPLVDALPGDRLRARVRARDVMIATTAPAGVSALNVLKGEIADVTDDGPANVIVTIRAGDDLIPARITRRSVDQLSLKVGGKVFALVKSVTLDGANRAPL
jgi:molybdate transport system ATP-binding protein